MAVTYRVDPPTGIVVFQDDGTMDFPEWRRAVLAALRFPAPSRRRLLSDRRHLTHPPSLGLLESIIGFVGEHTAEFQEAQWALLAAEGSPILDSFELGEQLARPLPLRVRSFTDLRPALNWLAPISSNPEIDRLSAWVGD